MDTSGFSGRPKLWLQVRRYCIENYGYAFTRLFSDLLSEVLRFGIDG